MMVWLLKLAGGSRIIAAIVAALACLVLLGAVWSAGYLSGTSRAEALCQTAVLEADNKALRKALLDQAETIRAANDRAAADAAELSILNEQVEDLSDAFDREGDHEGNSCRLSPDDAGRLQGIR